MEGLMTNGNPIKTTDVPRENLKKHLMNIKRSFPEV